MYSCQVCGHESHDRTNLVAHIGFIHGVPPCESCHDQCFGTCTTGINRNSPTSTQFPPVTISNWIRFLGEFYLRESVYRALDYTVDLREGKPTGRWVCALCFATDQDVGVIVLHIKYEHSPDTKIKYRRCGAEYLNIIDLDEHYCNVHSDHMPVQCTICSTYLPDRQRLNKHLEWHKNEDRSTQNNNFVSICSTCGCFFANGDEFNNHKIICTENGILDKNEIIANNEIMA